MVNVFSRDVECVQPARRPVVGVTAEEDIVEMEEMHIVTSLWIAFSAGFMERPRFAMAMWSFYLLQEVACLLLYVVTAEMCRSNPTWTRHDPESSSSQLFAGRTALAFSLLLQLPYISTNWKTIGVHLFTCAYPIILLFVYASGRTEVQYYYVPMWLRLFNFNIYTKFTMQCFSVWFPESPVASLLRLFAERSLKFAILICSFCCLLRIAEAFSGRDITLFNSFYMAVVTSATIGYGDYSPQTTLGRFVVIIYVFILFLALPVAVASLRRMFVLLRKWASYKGVPNHIVLCANPTYKEALVMLTVASRWSAGISLVFVSAEPFQPRVEQLQRMPLFRHRLVLLEGSILSKTVQRRCRLAEAGLVVIYSKKYLVGLHGDLQAFVASRAVSKSVPRIPQVLALNYHHLKFLHADSTVVQVHRKIMGKVLLATAVLQPGIVPFLINLVHSTADARVPHDLWSAEKINDWRNLYGYSRQQRLFEIPAGKLAPISLLTAADLLQEEGVLVLAVCRGSTLFMKHDSPIGPGDSILAVCASEDDAIYAVDRVRRHLDKHEREEDAPMSPTFTTTLPNNTVCAYPFLRETAVDAGGVSLEELAFANQTPAGVPLSVLPLDQVPLLRRLIDLRNRALRASTADDEEGDVTAIETDVNDLLEELAVNRANSILDADNVYFDELRKQHEYFLFIDQRTSVFHHPVSVFDHEFVAKETENELIAMMQCIRSSYHNSTASLLTVRPISKAFLDRWNRTMKFPLQCVKGDASLDRPLELALSDKASSVRGIIVFSSQTAPRDHEDTPVLGVDASVTKHLSQLKTKQYEHYLIVELGSFTSCRFVNPRHTDPMWLRDGEDDYQNCLAFMMGKVFAGDMLIPLSIQYYFNRRIFTLIDVLFNLSLYSDDGDFVHQDATESSASPPHDEEAGAREPFCTSPLSGTPTTGPHAPFRRCRFKFYGNGSLMIQTFRSAFRLFLYKKNVVLIGIFRQFPASEGLHDNPRYFITNPPQQAPLLPSDILYGVSIKN